MSKITDEMLGNFLERARASKKRELAEFGRFGPAFSGDYEELDNANLVLGSLTVFVEHLMSHHQIYLDDFQQLFYVLALADESSVAASLQSEATDAYKKAEERFKAYAKAVRLIGKKFGNDQFAANFRCAFPWEDIPEIQRRAREERSVAKKSEAEAAQAQAEASRVLDRARELGEADSGGGTPDPEGGTEASDTSAAHVAGTVGDGSIGD